jgi:hypothetical protein
MGIAAVLSLKEQPCVLPPIVYAEVGCCIQPSCLDHRLDKLFRLCVGQAHCRGEPRCIVAPEVAVLGESHTPPPEPVERTKREVGIPLHPVHQVERFGVDKQVFVTFDPGHGVPL